MNIIGNMKKTNNLKGESMNKENKQIKLISRPLDKKDGMVDLSGAFKTKVKEYKDYVVFKTTIHNDYEVWDYTYKTPTIWLCGILENLDDAKTFIDKCISNNKKAREERA